MNCFRARLKNSFSSEYPGNADAVLEIPASPLNIQYTSLGNILRLPPLYVRLCLSRYVSLYRTGPLGNDWLTLTGNRSSFLTRAKQSVGVTMIAAS